MSDDERALLVRVAAGDQLALSVLYRCYQPRLTGYLLRLLDGDTATVEEALQDTFMKMWRAASTFRGEASVSAWLFRIARNVALDARRHRHPNSQLPDDEPDELTTPALDEYVIERLALTSALAQLSPKHRETLELVYYQGFTLEEAAKIIGTPVGTMKSRLSYARQSLARILAWEVTHEA